MSYFPFFRDIEADTCLVIGGGKVAARKIEKLMDFGVKIKVVAPSISGLITGMTDKGSQIECIHREFEASDLDGIDFVIASDRKSVV